ncbi:MAG: protein phosphatase 2C domain-containing protein [Nitrosomonas sp.]|nr:protein phosphatase 2C domain-containing protein [Nitrosomonas sp.]
MWKWILAAHKGTSHEKSGVRLQDALKCFSVEKRKKSIFFGVVSDGAGSASHGGQGASIVCRRFAQAAKKYFSKDHSIPSDSTIDAWIDQARDSIFLAASRRSLTPRDFAATLICVISNGEQTLIAHIGDGCAVILDAKTKEWIAPSWPNHGEYASTTYFITDESDLKLSITRYQHSISSIAIFSDGLERLALDFSLQKPFAGFFDGISKPLVQSKQFGKDAALSLALTRYLNSEAINSRTDDDKSLIIALRDEH